MTSKIILMNSDIVKFIYINFFNKNSDKAKYKPHDKFKIIIIQF
jgi:hypothetical protein